ncbi:MATE family efflux transporter [Paenibacillus albidus]|uniref:MATE family efflux transporter n=1 Tax=Paenibacillus albidus TaxID=2041023 RepID=UPI001BEA40B7|nr:MATE family efflux transporter [Paenibacillus albidus]MBT2288454.1 MATE family efflux transporter [Paenibacillus albidus]
MLKDSKADFYSKIYTIAIPVTLQSLIMALLTLTDQLMVGQLGDVAVASVGISIKIYGIITVVLAGLATGVSIYAAQFWGKKDEKSTAQLLGLGLLFGMGISIIFTLPIHFFPQFSLSLFTKDQRLITEGAGFLKVTSLSYIPVMLTMIFSAILRATGHVKLPMMTSIVAVCINIILNYLLIFGNFGFPEWGVKGAAISTLMARLFECCFIIAAAYKLRLPGATHIRDGFGVSRTLMVKFLRTTYPIVLTELIWVLGETVYAIIYSRMGTAEITAMTITYPLQSLSIGLLSGLSSAAGIMIGNKLGADEQDMALDFSKRFIKLGIVVSLGIGVLIALIAPLYVSIFQVSDEAHLMGTRLVWVFAAFLWVKVANMILAGGILNSGGDSKFVFAMEASATWLIGVPSGLLMSFVWKQPVFLVYMILSMEEVVRLSIGLARIHSRKWMKNLVAEISA